MRLRSRSHQVTGTLLAATLLATMVFDAPAAEAAPVPTIRTVTWNVLGIDSNAPASSGPDTFPVTARVCNTGDAPASAVRADFVFDSANAFINLSGPSTLTLGDMAASACADAVFNAVVTRSPLAYDASRRYHVTASATGISPISTASNRELYVERLISQNRNSVLGITGSAIDVAPSSSAPGHATVVMGQTYDFTVTSSTATGGYEQLESFLNFPNTIVQVLAVSASYPQPPGATNDTVYADACGWDNVIGPRRPTGTYLSCVGPQNYPGGKAGGGPILTTYTVRVISTGRGSLSTLFYDFSGSSFHYNTDFGANLNTVAFDAVNPADLSMPRATPAPLRPAQPVRTPSRCERGRCGDLHSHEGRRHPSRRAQLPGCRWHWLDLLRFRPDRHVRPRSGTGRGGELFSGLDGVGGPGPAGHGHQHRHRHQLR